MVEAAADAGAARRHHHHRQFVLAGPGPALVAGDFEEVDGVEAVVAELDLGHGPAAGVGDAHGRADDAALVERRVPGGLEALRGGEDAAQRRADVLAEDVGDAEVLLAVVEGEANGLYERGHKRFSGQVDSEPRVRERSSSGRSPAPLRSRLCLLTATPCNPPGRPHPRCSARRCVSSTSAAVGCGFGQHLFQRRLHLGVGVLVDLLDRGRVEDAGVEQFLLEQRDRVRLVLDAERRRSTTNGRAAGTPSPPACTAGAPGGSSPWPGGWRASWRSGRCRPPPRRECRTPCRGR